MTDAFEERKKALEEEYFHRQERAALEKLRAKMNAEKAATAGLRCPKGCDGPLTAVTMQGVVVDRCEKCGGVWLDAGELETLTAQDKASGGFLSWLFGSR